MSRASPDRPRVSIVIPSHNRAPRLRSTLGALAPQLRDRADVEIVVCADGCRDDTASMVRSMSDLPLLLVELPGLGPAGARNAGAEAARGALLIFLDDDVEPGATFLKAHIEAHETQPGSVVIGPYPPLPIPSQDGFRLLVRQYWNQHFAAVAAPGHRMSYEDVLTGNLSLTKATFERVGPFDPTLRAHEDYEFGIRVIDAGVPVVCEERALAYHYEHETMQIENSFARAREEARADVAIARRHPAVGHGFKAGRWRPHLKTGIGNLGKLLLARDPRGGLVGKGAGLLPALDRRGLHRLHAALYNRLLAYWYARGLADCFATTAEWRVFARDLPEPQPGPPVAIDLRQGLEAADELLDRLRPEHGCLTYAGELVGKLAYRAGSERWAGRHLRPLLVDEFAPAYLRALADDGQIAPARPQARQRLAAAFTRIERHYPNRRPPGVWVEQAEQWSIVPPSPQLRVPE